MTDIQIKKVLASDTWALRHRVLRPHLPVESARYAADEALEAIHIAAFVDGVIVGIASVYQEAEAGLVDPKAWRLRGMATAPEVRGEGLGGRVLEQIIQLVQSRGGSRIWCNARTSVRGFYEKYAFVIIGDEFEMPGIGPHYFMIKNL